MMQSSPWKKQKQLKLLLKIRVRYCVNFNTLDIIVKLRIAAPSAPLRKTKLRPNSTARRLTNAVEYTKRLAETTTEDLNIRKEFYANKIQLLERIATAKEIQAEATKKVAVELRRLTEAVASTVGHTVQYTPE